MWTVRVLLHEERPASFVSEYHPPSGPCPRRGLDLKGVAGHQRSLICHQISIVEGGAWAALDCVSFVVMRRLGLGTALALDHHFAEQGFAVKPAAVC